MQRTDASTKANGMLRTATNFPLYFLPGPLGYQFLARASGNIVGGIQASAAGAILTMLASTMMPEAYEEGGPVVGLVTSVGFLVAFVPGRLQ